MSARKPRRDGARREKFQGIKALPHIQDPRAAAQPQPSREFSHPEETTGIRGLSLAPGSPFVSPLRPQARGGTQSGTGPVLGAAPGFHRARPGPGDAQKAASPPWPSASPPPSRSISPESRGGLWAPGALSWSGAGREGAQGEERRYRQTEAVLQAPGAGR